jgi:hypothetical protein
MNESQPRVKRLLKTLLFLMCCLFVNLTSAQKCGTQVPIDNKNHNDSSTFRYLIIRQGTMHRLYLDGCGWVIKIEGLYYEPVNKIHSDYLVEGKSVEIKYCIVNGDSICMIGPLIYLQSIIEN